MKRFAPEGDFFGESGKIIFRPEKYFRTPTKALVKGEAEYSELIDRTLLKRMEEKQIKTDPPIDSYHFYIERYTMATFINVFLDDFDAFGDITLQALRLE